MDPLKKERISKDEYEDCIEKLARDCISKEPTILSKFYSDHVMQELNLYGCIIDGSLSIEHLKECLENDKIPIDIFNKALWNKIEELEFE